MSETKLATVRFGIQSDVIDDTEILNLLESYHREYIKQTFSYERQKVCGKSVVRVRPY